MIEVMQHRIRAREFLATQHEGEVAQLAINSFGFLLHGQPFCTTKHYSFGEFADRIAAHYDCSNPRTAEVVGVMRSLHHRNQH